MIRRLGVRVPPLAALLPRMVAAAALAVLAIPAWPTGASAQLPPSAVGVSQESIDASQRAIGIIATPRDTSIAWVAAAGVVVTSDYAAREVGVAATFKRLGASGTVDCYVGVHLPKVHLSVMRCGTLSGPSLSIDTKFPEPGLAVTVTGLTARDSSTDVRVEGGHLEHNNVSFMGATRLQFSFQVRPVDNFAGGGFLDSQTIQGAPVISAEGKVVSALFVSPKRGGWPLGVTPAELTKAVSKALPLPDSFV